VFWPKAKMPTVLLPAAEPYAETLDAAVPVAFTSPEYVYLFLVVDNTQETIPSAKIPTVELPAAALP
jgi:hypothetical protein